MQIKTSLQETITLPRVSMADRDTVLGLRTVERLVMQAAEANEDKDQDKYLALEESAFDAAEKVIGNLFPGELEKIGPADLFILCSILKNGPDAIPEEMQTSGVSESVNPSPAGGVDQG